MSKITKKGWIFFGLLIALSLLLLLIPLFKNQESKSSDPDTKETISENHDHPDSAQDPFSDGTKASYTTESVTFEKPEVEALFTVPGTAPVLIDSTDRYLLFKSFGGYLYYYDLEKQEGKKIAEYVNAASISDNETYIVYTVRVETAEEESVHFFNLNDFFDHSVLDIASRSLPVSGIVYHEGGVFYTHGYREETSDSTQYKIVPKKRDEYLPEEQSYAYFDTSGAFDIHDNRLLVVSPETSTISQIQIGAKNLIPYKDIDQSISSPVSLEFNKKGDWFIHDRASDTSALYVNNERADGYTTITDVHWLTDTLLLVSQEGILTIYNTETKKSSVLRSDVHEFEVNNKAIYYVNPSQQAEKMVWEK
ncbi:hypothetical protein IMZ31_20955 (plasmid) [Pontibacillus sp. ALD_SL1]|uniref:hypothetical protein n=1 Tax=Pontibacillus sp. ALD_SL1 TaxID=2777185 RepID=UPI001A957E17|nr:hypothetical protein [Pontibacillus sp. ALD_SL1]QST03019.1 hypothetical protein IMZ31_20955 [Pontibacillus sp. ALD_SL1]